MPLWALTGRRPRKNITPTLTGHSCTLRFQFVAHSSPSLSPASPCLVSSICCTRAAGSPLRLEPHPLRPRSRRLLPPPVRHFHQSRSAASSTIGDYDTHVRTAAAAGHADIRAYSTHFRVLGSTASVDARDHTGTTYTASERSASPSTGWNGAIARGHYVDFYEDRLRRHAGVSEYRQHAQQGSPQYHDMEVPISFRNSKCS